MIDFRRFYFSSAAILGGFIYFLARRIILPAEVYRCRWRFTAADTEA